MWLPEDLNKVSEVDLRALKLGYRTRFLRRLSGILRVESSTNSGFERLM
jgi:hypothetical protein